MWITFVDKKTNKDVYINKKQISEIIITDNEKEQQYDVEIITSNGNRYSILEYKSNNKDLEKHIKKNIVQRIYNMLEDYSVIDIEDEITNLEYYYKRNNY